MTQMEVLQNKARRERSKITKYRYAYPELARQCKRNVQAISKQMKILQEADKG